MICDLQTSKNCSALRSRFSFSGFYKVAAMPEIASVDMPLLVASPP
jgi:hypothetical protein